MTEVARGGAASALSARQRSLVEAMLREKGLDRSPAIPRRKAGPPPLSFAQRRLWFLDQLGAGAAYNFPVVLRVAGSLDRDALGRALVEILRRHEALRATFHAVEGEPTQRIAAEPELSLSLSDLSGLPAEKREAEARRRATEEALLPFDLERGPLARAGLLRLGDSDHVLLLTLHHIVADGWSSGILTRELASLYGSVAAGETPDLPELPIQYGDFAAWQREWLSGEVLERQLAYWRQRLDGAPTLSLPTDRPRPPVQSFRGASCFHVFPESLADALRELSRGQDATLFMTLLAGFQVLLQRYTGQDDIVVGSPIANRNRREVEGLIGFFVNTLALRGDLSGDPAFVDLLRQVKETALGAYAHQDVPFEKLVEDLRPERDLGQNPIFQVCFALQNAPGELPQVEGLTLRPFLDEITTCRFDLELHLWETPKGLVAAAYYAADLFERRTIEALLTHYVRLLQGVAARPRARLSELPLLGPGEREQLIAFPAVSKRSLSTVLEMFGERVGLSCGLGAVSGGGRSLSYGELEERASRLAGYLRRLGVGPEVRVGVCVERSVDGVVGLLGVLKAGGAYVAMDPAYPVSQLEYVMSDAGVKVVLVTEGVRERLLGSGVVVVSVEGDWPVVAGGGEERLESGVSLESLAYVIYTSGSTGRPKGVEVSHRGLSNLVEWHRGRYGVGESDRASLIAGPGFDASVWELWPYLVSGASVHVPDEEVRFSPGRLKRWLAEEEITVCFLPTALAELFLKEGGFEGLSLRVLLTGGDKLHVLAEQELPFRVVNHYGPTECSVVSTCGEVETGGESDPSIGRAIDHARVYVLDGVRNLVPIGVCGELYIGGEGLARGYLGRPDLTAERFLPDGFSPYPGARMYRTGDLVRYRTDGQLQFLGRIDQQVKIRGFRIELGEVETTLLRHSAIEEAVVVALSDAQDTPRLVAYVVASPESHEEPEALSARLRKHLEQELPSHMVPSSIIPLPSLPLTPSGKIDRAGLPAPQQAVSEGARSCLEPRTPAEEQVAAIWREVLQRERVGVQDNFFDLGGHSLLLVQVHGRLREAFPERALSVVDLFRHPTIEALASHLSGPRAEGPGPPIEAESETESRVAGRERLGRRRDARKALVAEDGADA